MYVSDQFPDLTPLSIPSHSLTGSRSSSILGQLDEDVFRWDELLESDESRR